MTDHNEAIDTLSMHAAGVDFNLTAEYERQPSVITILFNKTSGVLKGYNALQERCGDIKPVLDISKTGNRADLVLRCRGIEMVRFTGVPCDEAQLDLFLRGEEHGRSIILAVGKMTHNGIEYLTPKDLFFPLLVTLS